MEVKKSRGEGVKKRPLPYIQLKIYHLRHGLHTKLILVVLKIGHAYHDCTL